MMRTADEDEDDEFLGDDQPPKEINSNFHRFTRNKKAFLSAISAIVIAAIIIIVVYFSVAGRSSQGERLTLSSDPDTRVVEMLQRYLQIKTAHPMPDYKSAVRLLLGVAEYFKFDAETFEVSELPYVLMKIEGSNPALESVVLLSHMDTVPVQESYWKYDPFGGYIDTNGNIYGRGAQDMKSIGVLYLEAMHRVVQSGSKLQRTVYLLFAPDEEIGINSAGGMSVFVNNPKWITLHAGVVLDEGMPSPLQLYTVFNGQRAIYQPTLTIEGAAGHGSLFINNTAISKLEVILSEALQFRREQQDKMMANNFTLGQVTSVNPTAIHAAVMANGVYTKNSVPPQAQIILDFRVNPSDASYVQSMITNWTTQLNGVTVDRTTIDVIPEVDLNTNAWWPVLLDSLHSMNLTVVTDIFPAATDGRAILKQNITVFCFSPLTNTVVLLHDHNEYVNNRTLIEGVPIYEKVIYNLANHV